MIINETMSAIIGVLLHSFFFVDLRGHDLPIYGNSYELADLHRSILDKRRFATSIGRIGSCSTYFLRGHRAAKFNAEQSFIFRLGVLFLRFG